MKPAKFFYPLFIITLFATLTSCSLDRTGKVHSPNGKLSLEAGLTKEKAPCYRLYYEGKEIIETSTLGMSLKDAPSLRSGFRIRTTKTDSVRTDWILPWGETKEVKNHYNELTVQYVEKGGLKREIRLVFRLYDDGLGFRYEIPGQEHLDSMVIMDEHSRFELPGDPVCWWIPGDWNSYEYLYRTTPFTEIDAAEASKESAPDQSYVPENAVNPPVTMRTDGGLYLSVHEAALTHYSGMTLKVLPEEQAFETEIVGSAEGSKVQTNTPLKTPWRSIQVSEDPGGLIESNLILNLNEPNKLGNVRWATPAKYAGIWWEMLIGKSTWQYDGGRHGATTANAKKYIDFAAENGIGAILLEGWNTGWELVAGYTAGHHVFDFVTPYPDYDLEEVARYAGGRNVELIMHHETLGDAEAYEGQMEEAYRLMERLGIRKVKTGYQGAVIPEGEYRHGQWMVNHQQKVLETAARYKIAVSARGSLMATGLRRTYPHAMSHEAVRGQEYNVLSPDGGNPPEHTVILPFTRGLAGPVDFRPGIFNLKIEPWKPQRQINTTLAKQLALLVVLYSPLQMAADLPEHYENHPAFQFIRDVPVDWEETRVLDAEIGEHLTMARKERNGKDWVLGSITDENPRELKIPLDFLPRDEIYRATMYADGEKAHWKENPYPVLIRTQELEHGDTLHVRLAPGGGAAVYLKNQTIVIEESERRKLIVK